MCEPGVEIVKTDLIAHGALYEMLGMCERNRVNFFSLCQCLGIPEMSPSITAFQYIFRVLLDAAQQGRLEVHR